MRIPSSKAFKHGRKRHFGEEARIQVSMMAGEAICCVWGGMTPKLDFTFDRSTFVGWAGYSS